MAINNFKNLSIQTHAEELKPVLQKFKAGERYHGFIEGPQGYIVMDTDFCHVVRELEENVSVETEHSFNPARKIFTLTEIRQLTEPLEALSKWGHYWGIKHRVASNYRLLLDALTAVGLDAEYMPKWGDRPAPGRLTNPCLK